MTIQRAFGFLPVLLLICSCVAESPVDPQLDTHDPVQVCYRLAAALQLYGFEPEKKECQLLSGNTSYDTNRMTTITDVSTPWVDDAIMPGLKEPFVSHLFSFYVDTRTGEVVSILNNYTLSLARQEKENPQKMLSKEAVIEKAKEYVNILAPDAGKLEVGNVRFDERHNSSIFAWRVCLFRTHEGYWFDEDYINISFHEQYGLCGYYKRFFSKPGPIDVKIERSEVKEKARELLDHLLKECGVDPQKELLNVTLHCEDTLFTNPYYYEYKTERGKTLKQEEAILAHEFIYIVTAYQNTPDGPKAKWKTSAMIYIDVQKGDYLGAKTTLPCS